MQNGMVLLHKQARSNVQYKRKKHVRKGGEVYREPVILRYEVEFAANTQEGAWIPTLVSSGRFVRGAAPTC